MKIVVDIPRKYYEDFKLQLPMINKKVPSEFAKYTIATGTPLPKGHGDLKTKYFCSLEGIHTNKKMWRYRKIRKRFRIT